MKQDLQQIGLTNSEAKIYLVLLENGPLTAGIVTRKSGIHRRSVYDAIERLIEKGLVSYIKTNNRKYFEAAPPDRLQEIIMEKEEILAKILPNLRIMKRLAPEKKETLFFRGKEALRTVFDDQIKEGKEILTIASSVDVNEYLQYYFPKFNRIRKEKGIVMKMLFSPDLKKVDIVKRITQARIRFLPKKFSSKVSINIYGNKVAMVVWKDSPTAILIEEKEIAEAYREYFSFLWNISH